MVRGTYLKPLRLVARLRPSGMEVLRTTLPSGEEALPVFGFEAKARMFLKFGPFGGGWRPRETSAGELISTLYCLRVGVDRVVLDPLPGPFAGLNDLLSVERRAVEEHFGRQGCGASPAPGAENARDQGSNPCVRDRQLSDMTTPTAASGGR